MSLTVSNPNVDYTNPDVMASNLATLATLMDNVTKTYALWVKVIQGTAILFEILCWILLR